MPDITNLLNPGWEILEVINLLDVVRDVARRPVIERARTPIGAIKVQSLRLASSREKLGGTRRKERWSQEEAM